MNMRDNVRELPLPPKPMTASILTSYLESIADRYPVEDEPVLINGQPIVNATVVDGHVVLRTWLDELNANPPCEKHQPTQFRDMKPPWCVHCGLTSDWKNPHA